MVNHPQIRKKYIMFFLLFFNYQSFGVFQGAKELRFFIPYCINIINRTPTQNVGASKVFYSRWF